MARNRKSFDEFLSFSNLINNNNFFSKKKAISPVVATALLLVVAVVAVVTFQGWFGNLESSIFSDVEIKSNSATDNTLSVDSIVGNTLYIKNNVEENLSINDLKIGDIVCNVSKNLSLGMNEIDISSCINNVSISTPDVVIITDKQVVQKSVFLKNKGGVSSGSGGTEESASLDCSSLDGGEWVLVPGNSGLGTSDFCVMKYEAKNDGSDNPISQPTGTPWVDINQTDARAACKSLGDNYSLITDPQWVTMARNAENTDSNWNSSTVGDGYMWTGHNDGNPFRALSVSDANDYYDQTNDSDNGTCDGDFSSWDSEDPWGCEGQKRVLELSNGEIVWDVAGNVDEWTNDTLEEPDSGLDLGSDISGWYEWTNISGTGYEYLGPSVSTYDYINGIGRVYADNNDASGIIHGFRRGGAWHEGSDAGVFTLYLPYHPSTTYARLSFRCSYTP
jgi:flagellin-like protein